MAEGPSVTADDAGPITTSLVVVAVLAPIFALTATWSHPFGIDTLTNVLSGYAIATEGTTTTASYEPLSHPAGRAVALYVDSPRGPVSQYPPGVALSIAPFYALSGVEAAPREVRSNYLDAPPVELPIPDAWPATLSALLTTVGGCAAVAVACRAGGARHRSASLVGIATGLTTGAWSVASDQPWQHGPAMLCIGVAVAAASRSRWWLTGVAFGAGIVVRPHIAVVAAAVGVGVTLSRRSVGPVVGVGGGALTGLASLLAYNHHVFGVVSISGGYPSDFADRALSPDVAVWASTVLEGLIHQDYGLLVWAPHAALLALWAWQDRRAVPDWSVAAALGGVAYLLLQWKANRASGGTGFFPYRYPIEMLTAAAPLLGLVAIARWREGTRQRLIVVVACVIAATGQLVGALGYGPPISDDGDRLAVTGAPHTG